MNTCLTENRVRARRLLRLCVIVFAVAAAMVCSSAAAHAADVEFTQPKDNKVFDYGTQVTIKIDAKYSWVDDSKKDNFAYFKITRGDTLIEYAEHAYQTEHLFGLIPEEVTHMFTPPAEGEYLIEACRDINYVNGTHVPLAPDKFIAQAAIRIKVQKDLAGAQITGITDTVYTGEPIQLAPTVVLDGKTLSPETDYDLAYSEDTTNVGVVTMTLTGKGFYKGTLTGTYKILPIEIKSDGVSRVVDATYTGSAITQNPVVTAGGKTLVKGTDYELSYANNKNVGTATVTVIGKGSYGGEVSVNFTIHKASIRNATVANVKDQKYTGNPLEPYPTVRYGGTSLLRGEDADFIMEYQDNVECGTAKIIITGKNNFKDSMARTFSIVENNSASGQYTQRIVSPKNSTEYELGSTVTVEAQAGIINSNAGNGITTEINPMYFKVTKVSSGEVIPPDRDPDADPNAANPCWEWYHSGEIVSQSFTLNEPGEYRIQVLRTPVTTSLGDDGHYHSVHLSYEDIGENAGAIATIYVGVPSSNGGPKDISRATVTGLDNQEYTGDAVTIDPVVTRSGVTLKKGTDYYLNFSPNVDQGPVAVTIHGKGRYTGSLTTGFFIIQPQLKSGMIRMTPAQVTYNGKLQKPQVVVRDGETILEEGTDYTLVNNGGTQPGEYPVTITAMDGRYFGGEATATFKINKIAIDSAKITVSPSAFVYDGTAKTPNVAVTLGGQTVPKDAYAVSYEKNTNAGTAFVKVTAKAASVYQGSAQTSFAISGKPISDATVKVDAIPDQTFVEGAALTPKVTVRDGAKTLTSSDFSVTYANNSKIGTATVTITGKGNYKGSRSDVTFRIINKQTTAGDQSDANEDIQAGVDENPGKDGGGLTPAKPAGTDSVKPGTSDPAEPGTSDPAKPDGTSTPGSSDTAKPSDQAETAASEQAVREVQALPSAEAVEKIILTQKTDKDPAGSAYGPLKLRSKKQSKKSNTLTWTKVNGASYYIVYGNKCGKKNKIKKIKTVKKNTFTHKKLKKGTYYKYVVVAVKDTVIGERTLACSKMIHVATKGGKNGNCSKVTVRAGKSKKAISKVSIKKGKTVKLKVKMTPASKKQKIRKHTPIRYESTNKSIVKVSKKGVITAKKKGTCKVYVYAQNGISKTIKVTVR